MAFKFFVVCASILLLQSTIAQVIQTSGPSNVNGNSVVNNEIRLSSPSQLSSISGLTGLGNNLFGSGSAGSGLARSGLAGAGLAGAGLAGAGLSSGLAGAGLSSGLAASGLNAGLAGASFANPFSGLSGQVASGPLTVTSISPIGPSGLAVASENVLEGVLTVNGQLPFLSAVAFEGPLPTSGSGVATCGCGSGSVGIVSEGLPQGVNRALAY